MYLKQIELENFKSFGGKMTIPLMEGYLAVTGPNGSGKSNIADAILFVLGPKSSKAIRAGKLTDLLFDGGKTKKRAEYAKVSLVFDNTDRILQWNDDTVRLTRLVRLAANGEDYYSYFYINDQKSTMSEFDSLLSRARISADGYNLVQQGDVTRIVQMGALERRRILDSISGIASYDADLNKANAEKAEASVNLDRITIIMHELETQISQLKNDMEAAKLYMATVQRLDVAKAQQVHRQLIDRRSKMDSLNENIVKTNAEIGEMKVQTDAIKAKMDEIQGRIDELEAEIREKVGPEYDKVKQNILNLRVDLANLTDRMNDLTAQNEEIETDIADATEELTETDARIGELQDRIKCSTDLHAEKTKDLEAQKAEEKRIEAEMSSKGGEHKKLQDRANILDTLIDSKSEEVGDINRRFTACDVKQDELSRTLSNAEQDLDQVGFQIKDAEWGLSEMKKETGADAVKELQQKIMDAKSREGKLEKQEGELDTALNRVADEYNRLLAEKKVSDKMRGSEAVTKILELRDRGELKGVHGTIAELATVDPEFELALSTAAGGKMQAIVVDNDQVAADAMAILKKTGAGRATFLPLNKMAGGKPRAKAIMVVKKTRGYAIDLIDFDPMYRDAFWYVFGDTLVTDTLDQARSIMGNVRIVSRTGELIEASGAMVGGTVRHSSMRFGTASQSKLEEVSQEYRAARDSMDALQELLKGVRSELRELDNQLRTANAGSVEAQGKIGKLEAQLTELKQKKSRLTETQAKAKADLDSNTALYKETSEALEAGKKDLSALTEERKQVRDRIAQIAPVELQEQIRVIRSNIYDLTNELSELKDSVNSLRSECKDQENSKKSLVKFIGEKQTKLDANNAEIARNKETAAQKEIELKAVNKIMSEMEAGISGLREKKDALVEEKYGMDGDRKTILEKITGKEGFLATVQASVITTQQEIDQLEAEVAQITIEVPQPIPSEDELKRTIRSCENTIAKIGQVNLRAIDDYNEKSERYASLTDDKKKLEAQIKDLNNLTDSLNAEKKGLFMKTYDGIDVNFREIYKELSGGGEAFMKLEDEDDPFSGGLLINAKPRNGKLLRLEALSGGEKSLTALAFIFAIQEFQPSPFYVLDEVDMFLDSVNAEMVAKRVKKSSAKAQFIQVSLRKVTLALADHLVGVTRQPNGMSKVIMQPDLAEVSKYEEQAKVAAADQPAEGA